MTLRASIVSVMSFGSFLFATSAARAITLPDSGTCSSNSGVACLEIANTDSGTSAFGLKGSTNSGRGVWGVSTSGYAVFGASNTGTGVYGGSLDGIAVIGDTLGTIGSIGVYGHATSGNGVVASNNDTTMAAAAVSALAGNSSGLAYYGTGNIIISGSLAQKAGGGSWSAPSDARIKKDVTPLNLGLDQLRQVRPVTYKYNGLGGTTDDGHEYVGVIAQELEKIFPNMVTSKKGKLHESDAAPTDIKVVDPSALTYVLINAVKEQQQIIDGYERRLVALEHRRNASLSALTLDGGSLETGLAIGLLPLGFIVLRRRKQAQAAS